MNGIRKFPLNRVNYIFHLNILFGFQWLSTNLITLKSFRCTARLMRLRRPAYVRDQEPRCQARGKGSFEFCRCKSILAARQPFLGIDCDSYLRTFVGFDILWTRRSFVSADCNCVLHRNLCLGLEERRFSVGSVSQQKLILMCPFSENNIPINSSGILRGARNPVSNMNPTYLEAVCGDHQSTQDSFRPRTERLVPNNWLDFVCPTASWFVLLQVFIYKLRPLHRDVPKPDSDTTTVGYLDL